jgi:hypothetical protein
LIGPVQQEFVGHFEGLALRLLDADLVGPYAQAQDPSALFIVSA